MDKVFVDTVRLLLEVAPHVFRANTLVLKGGTALNLFWFDVPRLSVDIDLNYVGQVEREAMLAERPQIETAVQAVCSHDGLTIVPPVNRSHHLRPMRQPSLLTL